MIDPGHKSRLNRRHLQHFEGDSLFARIGRAVCEAECLPRKELYESWEVARRVRRRLRGVRVVDLAAGHGLVGIFLVLLNDVFSNAVCVDRNFPSSAARLREVFERRWPRLHGRIQQVEGPLESVDLRASDVVVSAHACGALTDEVLALAVRARASVAVLPCCHEARTCDTSGLDGWMDTSLAVDVVRATRLQAAGYRVFTQRIEETITPKNRLLIGRPE